MGAGPVGVRRKPRGEGVCGGGERQVHRRGAGSQVGSCLPFEPAVKEGVEEGEGCTVHPPLRTAQVAKLEEVYGLKKYVPGLTYLDLSDNPICDDKSYRWGEGF